MLHEQFVAKWERIRQKGRRRFIWTRGVLGWGLIWGMLMSVWSQVEAAKNPGIRMMPILIIPLGLILGAYFGAFVWK